MPIRIGSARTVGFATRPVPIMKIRWAAKMHKIPVDELVQEFNAAVH